MQVGELVGARLIAHAGSLMNLAKHPASTVQILGAEKVYPCPYNLRPAPEKSLLYPAPYTSKEPPTPCLPPAPDESPPQTLPAPRVAQAQPGHLYCRANLACIQWGPESGPGFQVKQLRILKLFSAQRLQSKEVDECRHTLARESLPTHP